MDDKSTVLIVDDETVVRQILIELLAEEGYCLTFGSSGAEALAQASTLTPDLILLDVMMPDMDGFETCQRLRANPFLAEVPIVMLTALDTPGQRLRGIEAGADDYISKPFDPIELLSKVRTITRLNRYRRLLEERTRREHAEEALRQSEERYRIISELTSDYAYAFRVEPDGTLVPEWATEAFTQITGFNLVLMDVRMPGMSGLDAARQLKVEMPELRIIILSLYDFEEYKEAAMASGVNHYIVKRSLLDELVPAIRSTG